jgi:enoyl-CoA hydratase
MTNPLVNASKQDGVTVLELSNPSANTYSYEMMRELDAHILAARFDPAVHVIVVTGAGDKFFCAGADLKMLEGADPYFKYNFCLHANETLCRLEQTAKLVIAAINGHCVGGGLEIALACDLRIARTARRSPERSTSDSASVPGMRTGSPSGQNNTYPTSLWAPWWATRPRGF